ncbi:MAG: hypothetical protein LIP11_02135 [Clostridiales bacterium]|nr:hypothetical protein [Clostridiales bacterium]
MAANENSYLKNSNPWVAKYVSAYSLGYMADETKSALDIMVLNHASMKLIAMLLNGNIDIKNACLYITSLDNYLWNLEGTAFDIEKNINHILYDPEQKLLQTVKEMEGIMFQSGNLPDKVAN